MNTKQESNSTPLLIRKDDRGNDDIYPTKILLVEDVEIIQKTTKLFLEELHCEATIASCGKEAIEIFATGFDLIILDIGLPDMSGYDVSNFIRESNLPQAGKIPIIGHTAHNISDVMERCYQSGMDAVYNKFTSSDDLGKMLLHWLPSKFKS